MTLGNEAGNHQTFLGWPTSQRLVGWTALTEPLWRWARSTPHATFIIAPDSGAAVTYLHAWNVVVSTSRKLRDNHGIRPGSRVAVITENTIDCLLTILSIAHSGALCIPLNPKSSDGRLRQQLEASGASVVVALENRTWNDVAWIALAELVEVHHPKSLTSPAAGIFDQPATSVDQPVFMFYTTGTTAASKGVLQSAYNVLVNITALAVHHKLGPGRRLEVP